MVMGDDVIAVAKFDYTANQDNELTIHKNDRLVVLDSSRTWWRVKNENMVSGYVPSNYLEVKEGKLKESVLDRLFKKKKKKNSSSAPPPSKDADPSVLNITVTAKFQFEATRDDELSLNKGDKLVVTEKVKDGWWKGEMNGKSGYFPSNFVSEGDLPPSPTTPTTPVVLPQQSSPFSTNNTAPGGGEFVCGVRALYTNYSELSGDLSFVNGELMDIVENPTDGQKWSARKADGTVGLVSRHLVEIVQNAIPVFNPSQRVTMPPPPPGPPDFPKVAEAPAPTDHICPFSNQLWYYGQMSRNKCDRLLHEGGNDGDFLVRDSESKVGDYSISLKAPLTIKHFKVQCIDGQYAIGQRRYNSMEELIRHYTHKSPIFTSQDNAERLYLVKPFDNPASRPSPGPNNNVKGYMKVWD